MNMQDFDKNDINVQIPKSKYYNGNLLQGMDINNINFLHSRKNNSNELALKFKTYLKGAKINFKNKDKNIKLKLPTTKLAGIVSVNIIDSDNLKYSVKVDTIRFVNNTFSANKKIITLSEGEKLLFSDILKENIQKLLENSKELKNILKNNEEVKKTQKEYIQKQYEVLDDIERYKYIKKVFGKINKLNEEEVDKMYIYANNANLIRNNEGKFVAIKNINGKTISIEDLRKQMSNVNINDKFVFDLTKYGIIINLKNKDNKWHLKAYERKTPRNMITKNDLIFKIEYKNNDFSVEYEENNIGFNPVF